MSDGAGPRADEVSALVLAAGLGERMGGRPKAFLQRCATTLIERAVALVAPFASEIIVGLPPDGLDKGRRLLAGQHAILVAGGVTRQETVTRLLARATLSLVLLHEVTRPSAPPNLFAKVLTAGKEQGAAALYLPPSRRDSLAFKDDDALGAPLARERVIRVQTPQAYRREILLDSDRQGRDQGWNGASTTSLVYRAGYRVHLVPGVRENVKLTYPEDWETWEAATAT